MRNSHATVRGARVVLAFHQQVNSVLSGAMTDDRFSGAHYNGDGSHYPSNTYTADEMLNVSNFSAKNQKCFEVWIEVAVFLEENGIPLATVSCILYDEPILFLVEQDREKILSHIQAVFEELADWE